MIQYKKTRRRREFLCPPSLRKTGYPEAITLSDRRKLDRHKIDRVQAPLFAHARLTIMTSSLKEKSYDLKVFEISEKGVGVFVGEETQELLEEMYLGKRLEGIDLLASWTTIKVSGTVKHKSGIDTGKYRGFHLVGIQLDEELEHYI